MVKLGLVWYFIRFNYPADVALGTNGTLFVADLHSLRRISMPEKPTTVLGVGFDGRVSTAAGGAEPGEADGTGPEVNRVFLQTTAGCCEGPTESSCSRWTPPASREGSHLPCGTHVDPVS